MEPIVHAAIEEICARSANGLSLSQLWPKLHNALSAAGLPSPADDAVKRAFWSNLRAVPGILFFSCNSNAELDGSDPKVQSVEEYELLDLKIVASEQLRDCSLGLYDNKAATASITDNHRQVLERLAMARGNGITQNQLSKELGMAGNNFFYVVKGLETRGLVVRQPTIIRTKDASSDVTVKNSSLVNTNLIHLYRYATPLGSQQRLEITKSNRNIEENTTGIVDGLDAEFDERGQEHVLVTNFLPAMEAVCERLEQADGKVLVVGDIKVDLGYRETSGHRRWRNICNRLQQAGLVEVFEAEVDDKNAKTKKKRKRKTSISCLRLLKSFSPKLFEPNILESGHDEVDSEQLARGQSEQLVELPIEHQIFDMVDAEGSKGLVVCELSRRLGISNKKNHSRIETMSPRFGLHHRSENLKKGVAYRCWTSRNFQSQPMKSLSKRQEDVSGEIENISPSVEKPLETIPYIDCLVLEGDLTTPESVQRKGAEQGLSSGPQEVGGSDQMLTSTLSGDPNKIVPAGEYLVEVADCDGTLVDTSTCVLQNPMKTQSRQRYPTQNYSQREHRILERLKEEKFILKSELQRWLENLEDRHTKIDRKTVTRCLVNLQKEGHCKIANLMVPGLTKYDCLRPVDVILHASVSSSIRDLSHQIHEKLRSFELHVRQTSYHTKIKQSVATLTSIQRLQHSPNTDLLSSTPAHVGSVLPKMVRARLLHMFLWGYVNDSPGTSSSKGEQLFVSRNPHSTCKLFALEEAVKASPLELFIKVVGSIHKHLDIRDKHKNGALLSHLAPDECKQLMSTQAMGRLSRVIDILRRLKLIRMVADEHVVDGIKAQHAILTHALELKPYVEEPQFIDPVSDGSGSPDLRPNFRHDFVLMTKEALEEYWQTLEYCYSASNPKAALHAFPGSTVHELFYSRSWTRFKVIAGEHRSELIKRILTNDQYAKLTFKECKEIANDLNLSLAQVLRVYYHKQLRSPSRNQGVLSPHCQDPPKARNPSPLKKRKINSVSMSSKNLEIDQTIECEEEHHTEIVKENRVNEQLKGVRRSTRRNAMPSLKQTCTPKFLWNDEADIQLLIQYARKRATQGAQGLESWASITDLPASPSCCKKRIAVLNKDINFRNSLMRLCNLLSQRYAQQLDEVQKRMSSCGVECNQDPDYQKDQWDNFDDDRIKMAFDEVKKRLKDICKGTESIPEGTHGTVSATPSEFEQSCTGREMSSSRMASHHRIPEKFVKRWEEWLNVAGESFKSVAVANAIELFKLVFLSTSTSSEAPNLLAETLRCYSEHDLFSAFDYLRQKRIMVKSRGSHPYVLSQHFLQGLSLSEFPANTGKKANKLSGWIHEREKDLMDGDVTLSADLQCGDIFHLFALVSCGELTISPLLPDEGVGEADDSRSLKRRLVDPEIDSINKKTKSFFQESEICSRREKGFPGIQVLLSRATISRPDVVEFFKDDDIHSLLSSESNQFYTMLSQQIHSNVCNIDCMKEAPDFGSIATEAMVSGESQWEVMANFANQVLRLSDEEQKSWIHPSLFQSITRAIQKAGDQGLSMLEVSELICMSGNFKAEDVIDVLHAFGLAFKVNGYDSFHVVDPLYRSKYFLNSKASRSEDTQTFAASVSSQRIRNGSDIAKDQDYDNSEAKRPREGKNIDEVHKVTILNLSENANKLSDEIDHGDEIGQCSQSKQIPEGSGKENEHIDRQSSNFQPIVPWMNGDGTVNGIVYKGLRRRILGIVMQNPGVSEDDVISQMDVINPQSCKKLLEFMILDNHILVRKMHQTKSFGPPSLLRSLCGTHVENPKFVFREHLFANPMSTSLL